MMDNLIGSQETPQVLLHDEAVLHYVPLRVSVRMIRREQRPIASACAVGDPPLESRMRSPAIIDALPCSLTRQRAELLRTPPAIRDVLATVAAGVSMAQEPLFPIVPPALAAQQASLALEEP